ncbi:hypothetical protein HPP92_004371 [Vanilla planifolia]|uniref:Uncharacterized protein n=1 Tax=Vanilla planifolia TaxID=51239 RepID=A0A835RWK8_VANPL|nr:hypothetical protein HPP92_004371 [Vanilla planifolia]
MGDRRTLIAVLDADGLWTVMMAGLVETHGRMWVERGRAKRIVATLNGALTSKEVQFDVVHVDDSRQITPLN